MVDSIIIGLGNPGQRYVQTRHNAGFELLDFIADDDKWPELKSPVRVQTNWQLPGMECLLCKPLTFMNRAGVAAAKLKKEYPKIEFTRWWVAHDDLDLALGKFKLQFGRGPKLHNGLDSIYQALGTSQIWHVRIGADSRQGDRSIPGSEYVLQRFSPTQYQKLLSTFPHLLIELKRQLMAS